MFIEIENHLVNLNNIIHISKRLIANQQSAICVECREDNSFTIAYPNENDCNRDYVKIKSALQRAKLLGD